MNEWAKRRKRIILLIFLGMVLFLGAIPLALILYETPTCFDGRMNGDEGGVDCGGSCQLLCMAESLPVLKEGDARVLYIASSTYEVVALFKNPNVSGEVEKAKYTINLYSGNSTVPLRTLEGETFIPKNSEFAIFEGPYNVSEGGAPVRATFAWDGEFFWQKNTEPAPEVRVRSQSLSNASSTPRLEVEAFNASLERVDNVELTALISDESGNIFAASRTYIDTLEPGDADLAIFTWPRPFTSNPVDIKVYVRIYPDRSFIR